jgi:hypothetical protein
LLLFRVAKDGVAKDGVAKDGVAKDGVAKDGVAKDGVAKDGVAWRVELGWSAFAAELPSNVTRIIDINANVLRMNSPHPNVEKCPIGGRSCLSRTEE